MKPKKRTKTGGRKKGTPNRVTSELRDRVNYLIEDNFEKVIQDIESLEPKDRIDVFIKLLDYAIPKLQRVDNFSVTQKINTPIQVNIDVKRSDRNKEIPE